jgi:hypothetical protein
MPRFPRLQASLVLLLVWESSCRTRQAAVPLPSPPPSINPPASQGTAPATANSETPAPPTTTTPAQEPTPYQVNKPAAQPAARKPARPATAQPTAPTNPSVSAPASAPATSAAPPAPPPKLGDVLTPDERKQYGASIDQSLSRAQTSLNSIAGRQLNKDQQAEVEQIRNFMQQAQGSRGSDPGGAKSLAERAEVLARDLAATFR